jgi:hypothetical protein
MSEPLLIRCPTCQHALHLPESYLGQTVTCLECRTPFRATRREGDAVGTGGIETVALPKPSRVPARLFIPMFGLLLFGFMGVFINGYLWWWFHNEPQAAVKFAEANLQFLIETAPPKPAEPKVAPKTAEEKTQRLEDQKRQATDFAEKQQEAARNAAAGVDVVGMKRLRLIFGLVGLGIVVGGFCFALRRAYPYCFVACVLSMLNTPDMGCCFFGAVIGIWGIIVLVSDEGRAYFGRSVSAPLR